MDGSQFADAAVPAHREVRSGLLRLLFILAAVLVVWESWLLVSRAGGGRSDIGVFIRSAVMLNEGAGEEFYRVREANGWYHAVPPAALSPFQPLVRLGPTGAGVGWALANLLFLMLGLWALWRTAILLKDDRATGPEIDGGIYLRAYPWLAILFVGLAAGSIQVGQFSLLFVTCWLVALKGLLEGRCTLAGGALAVPACLKVYPALLVAAPTVLRRRGFARLLAAFFAGAAVVTVALPSLTLGGRTGPMVLAWLRYGLLGSGGRVQGYLAGPGPATTQSMESLLARYLETGTSFHVQYAWVPHMDVGPVPVLALTGVFSISALFVAAWATLRLRRSAVPQALKALYSLALWSATLYAILPETKARYAIYTFLAFLPMVGWTYAAKATPDWRTLLRRALLTGACLAAVIQALPPAVIALGLGYLGSLALWGWNLWWVLREADRVKAPPLPGTADPVASLS